ncbi:transmembrane protease serine 9, partial [Hyalella azteca]|uniref:Transmembrane protease serine 9 n=1 Tax=Hyalella azteca TaxID=294128 RepID=A0A979FHJ5_HYAAZ
MTFQGDQGGPLTCPSFATGQYLLVGALSGGVECATEGMPDIFSDYTGTAMTWIHDILIQRFGRLEEPLPEPSSGAAAVVGASGPGLTAGSFFYDDGGCDGYQPSHVQHSTDSPLRFDQAQVAELPWVVLLLNTSGGGALVVGGGALVHPKVVLTTATRVNSLPVSDMVAVLGEWNRTSLTPPLPRQDHVVQEYVIHPRFNASSLENDMALIVLRDEAVYAPNVQSICLAQTFEEVDRTKCISGGWGIPSQDTFEFVEIQKRINIPIVDVDTCTQLLRQSVLGPNFFLFEGFFCGGGVERPGTCMGDEGSPLACPSFEDGRYKLVGALSGGVQCGAANVPDIFKSYMDGSYAWIKETITQRFPPTSRSARNKTVTSVSQNDGGNSTQIDTNLNFRPLSINHSDGALSSTKGNRESDSSAGQTVKAGEIQAISAGEGKSATKLPEVSPTQSLNVNASSAPERSFDDQTTLMGSFGEGGCSLYNHPGYIRANDVPLAAHQSQPGEMPWVALLQSTQGAVLGAGALIHPRVVVTAATFLRNSTSASLRVVLGEWDRTSGSEAHPAQHMAAEKIIFHPHLNETHNDIALIVLERAARGGPHVQSVCLAQHLEEVDRGRCVVNGWGTIASNARELEVIQKRIMGSALPQPACEGALKQVLGPDFSLPESYLCSGGVGGPSVCQGDQGAPLVCPSFTSQHYLLVGVLSGGVECGEVGTPDIYSSIIHHRNWILTNVDQEMRNLSANQPTTSVDDVTGGRLDQLNRQNITNDLPSNLPTTTADETNVAVDATPAAEAVTPAAVGKATVATTDPAAGGKATVATTDPAAGGKATVATTDPAAVGKASEVTTEPAAVGKASEVTTDPAAVGKATVATTDPADVGKATEGPTSPAQRGHFSALGSFTEDGRCSAYTSAPVFSASDAAPQDLVSDVSLGELPWSVLLAEDGGGILGSGALIHPRVVITSPSVVKG